MSCQQLKVQEFIDFTKKSGFLKNKNPKMGCPGLPWGDSERLRSVTLSSSLLKWGMGVGVGG